MFINNDKDLIVSCDGKPAQNCIDYNIEDGLARCIEKDDKGNIIMEGPFSAKVILVKGVIKIKDKQIVVSGK